MFLPNFCVEIPDSCPDFEGHAASGFRHKLHVRTESLSLESLDMSRVVGRESLYIPKFGAKVWTWVAKVWTQTFATHVHTFAPNFGMYRLSRPMSRFLQTIFGMSSLSRPMSRLSRQMLVCPDFRNPCPDFCDQLWHVQTFATRGATHVHTFQTLCPHFSDSKSRRDYEIWA